MRPLTPTQYERWLRQGGHQAWPGKPPRRDHVPAALSLVVLPVLALLSVGVVVTGLIVLFRWIVALVRYLGGG